MFDKNKKQKPISNKIFKFFKTKTFQNSIMSLTQFGLSVNPFPKLLDAVMKMMKYWKTIIV